MVLGGTIHSTGVHMRMPRPTSLLAGLAGILC
jgi:hypothetical protein